MANDNKNNKLYHIPYKGVFSVIDVLQEIERRLELLQWSHYELAKRAGITESTLSSMFQKRNLPTLFTLERICNAFEIPMEQFLLGNKAASGDLTEAQTEWLTLFDKLYPDEQTAILRTIRQLKGEHVLDDPAPSSSATAEN